MGIKDETPEDKVIFDSIDNRMKYSKEIQKEVKTCENCYNKETNPNKYPCNNCLDSTNNNLPFWYPAGEFEGKKVLKKDIVKTESELDIKLNDIQDKVRQIYERQLLMYDMLKDIYDSLETEDSPEAEEENCTTCKWFEDYPYYGACDGCLRNRTGSDRYEKTEDIK